MKRKIFIDSLRGLAIALMVINHCGHYLVASPHELWSYEAIYLTVVLAGPLFLFIAGFSLALTSGHDYWHYLKRGAILILAGYLVNLLFFYDEPLYRSRILFAIGLSIVMAAPLLLWLKGKMRAKLLFALSVSGFAVSSLFVPAFSSIWQSNAIVANVLFGEFPLLPWLFLFLIGLAAGAWFVTASEAARSAAVPRIFLGGSLALIFWLAAYLVMVRFPFQFETDNIINDYWSPSLLTCLWLLSWISILSAAVYRLAREENPLSLIGRHSLLAYFCQFFLIKTLAERLSIRVVQPGWFLAYAVSVMIIIMLICWLIERQEAVRSK